MKEFSQTPDYQFPSNTCPVRHRSGQNGGCQTTAPNIVQKSCRRRFEMRGTKTKKKTDKGSLFLLLFLEGAGKRGCGFAPPQLTKHQGSKTPVRGHKKHSFLDDSDRQPYPTAQHPSLYVLLQLLQCPAQRGMWYVHAYSPGCPFAMERAVAGMMTDEGHSKMVPTHRYGGRGSDSGFPPSLALRLVLRVFGFACFSDGSRKFDALVTP